MHLSGYVWLPTTNLKKDPVLDVVDGVVLHVDGGNASSLYRFFDGITTGIESTAFLPKSAKNRKEQYRDTTREADAQADGNSWMEADGKRHGLLSLETQGFGSGEWTPHQIEGIKDFILQTRKEHKFPMHAIQLPHGKGVGYHAQFPSWNPNKHSCPGAGRIQQFNEIIVPWLKTFDTKFYTTKAGDTAPNVAAKFHLQVWELWRLNPNVNLPFKVGTKLRVL